MAAVSSIAEKVASIAGAEHTQITGESIVVAPRDTEEVSTIVRYASQHGWKLGLRGGGTKQHWLDHVAPVIVISLARLNRLMEHPWQDLTCTVQAGCPWALLQDGLARHGQFVALDPLFSESATVGGVLATNDSGALRHRYGSLRDLVIGMTLVLADGTIAKTGGKVVKNVAGYDLCKLMTGSYGTLAIITEATFRLHPKPQHARSFTVAAESALRVARLVAAIRASHLLTQSLQIRRSRGECFLDVCLNAHPLAQQDAALAAMVSGEGLTMAEAHAEIWKERGTLYAPGDAVLRIATLPTEVCDYVDALQDEHAIEVRSVSQAIGLHDVAIRGERDAVTAFVERLRSQAARAEATVSVRQSGMMQRMSSVDVDASVLKLMQAVKHQFDPHDILNPGRFF